MEQGYSGSSVQRKGNLVEKASSDQSFLHSRARQRDLLALSRQLAVLPNIERIARGTITMEFIDGKEGLTIHNARQTGEALRSLHEQRGYPHPCMTGLEWLVDMANENLNRMNQPQRISAAFTEGYAVDALIHSEPVQVIEKKDGSIVFIDFEGIGMGSRYQDLGYVCYAFQETRPEVFTAFLHGYQSGSLVIDPRRIQKLAGLIALAYTGFALDYAGRSEAEQRMALGFRYLNEVAWNAGGSWA